MKLQRKKVGLALGGGVARGLAHVGVISVLRQAGIPVDYLAASSAGTLVGAPYCAGVDIQTIKQYGLSMGWWDIARPTWPWRGLFSFNQMASWLINQIGDIEFEDLKVPFVVLATDMETGEPVQLSRGRLAPAVQASCSIPGLVTPVRINGRVLGDGSLVDSVPVQALRQMGAEYVIGVDIFTTSPRPHLGPLGALLTSLEILVERAGGGIGGADCLIKPALAGKSYLRFSKRQEYFRLGEQAAQEKVAQICEDIFEELP